MADQARRLECRACAVALLSAVDRLSGDHGAVSKQRERARGLRKAADRLTRFLETPEIARLRDVAPVLGRLDLLDRLEAVTELRSEFAAFADARLLTPREAPDARRPREPLRRWIEWMFGNEASRLPSGTIARIALVIAEAWTSLERREHWVNYSTNVVNKVCIPRYSGWRLTPRGAHAINDEFEGTFGNFGDDLERARHLLHDELSAARLADRDEEPILTRDVCAAWCSMNEWYGDRAALTPDECRAVWSVNLSRQHELAQRAEIIRKRLRQYVDDIVRTRPKTRRKLPVSAE